MGDVLIPSIVIGKGSLYLCLRIILWVSTRIDWLFLSKTDFLSDNKRLFGASSWENLLFSGKTPLMYIYRPLCMTFAKVSENVWGVKWSKGEGKGGKGGITKESALLVCQEAAFGSSQRMGAGHARRTLARRECCSAVEISRLQERMRR